MSVSPLRVRDFRLLLFTSVAVFSGVALLLSVVPLWVVHNNAGEFAAGGSTAAFMASTVAAQFAVPRLVRAWGYRLVTASGAVLLGAPAPLLLIATDWPGILAVSLLRGIGFGFVTVCGAALVAELLPRTALANGSGLYGLAVGLPQLIGLPAGTAAVEHWGFVPVFLVAGVIPLLGLVAIFGLPAVAPTRHDDDLPAKGSLRRPWLVMLSGSIGYGALVTFLPLALTDTVAASAALFASAGAGLASRWVAGRLGTRIAAGRMLPWGLALTVFGMAGLAASIQGESPWSAVAAVAVAGVGFGLIQNDSLVVMFAAAPVGRASVAWNVAFDAGTGVGAVVVGALVAGSSYSVAFGLLALSAAALLPVALSAGRAV
jgi:predicted MFS family arabinose efflux permease